MKKLLLLLSIFVFALALSSCNEVQLEEDQEILSYEDLELDAYLENQLEEIIIMNVDEVYTSESFDQAFKSIDGDVSYIANTRICVDQLDGYI